MKSFTLGTILLAMLAGTVPPAAQAIEYNQVQADKSATVFGYRQMGVAMDGKFRKAAAGK